MERQQGAVKGFRGGQGVSRAPGLPHLTLSCAGGWASQVPGGLFPQVLDCIVTAALPPHVGWHKWTKWWQHIISTVGPISSVTCGVSVSQNQMLRVPEVEIGSGEHQSMCVCTCMYKHTCTHVYEHTRVCTYTCTVTCSHARPSSSLAPQSPSRYPGQ